MNIITKIAPKCIFFGPVLLNDDSGNTVNVIWKEKLANSEDATMEILRRWLNGEGAEVTWDILVESLRHVDLNVVAKEIDDCLI